MNNKKRLHCVECGACIDDWEEVYEWESGWVCEDCFDALVRQLTRHEMADLLGSRVRSAEEAREES